MSRPAAILLPLALAFSSLAGQAPTPDAPVSGAAEADRLNVRLGPDTGFPVIGQVGRGEQMVVRKVEGGWCEIDLPRDMPVWVSASHVEIEGDADSASEDAPVSGSIASAGVRLRSRPSLRSVILGERQRGDRVLLTGVFRDWYRIAPPADLRCYVSSEYVKLGDPVSPGERKAESVVLPLPPLDRIGPEPVKSSVDAATVARARDVLEGAPTVRAAEDALGELASAYASGDENLRREVRVVLAGLEPQVWLALLAKARLERDREIEGVSRRYEAEKLSVGDDAPPKFTAQGVLQAPLTGSRNYRLSKGGAVVFELRAGGADLSPFIGMAVGVIGRRGSGDREGEPPVIEVEYVEQIQE